MIIGGDHVEVGVCLLFIVDTIKRINKLKKYKYFLIIQ